MATPTIFSSHTKLLPNILLFCQLNVIQESGVISSVAEMEDKDTHNYQGDTNDPDQTLPVILKKESDQLGMLEYNKDQEDKLLRAIITELKPRIAAQMLPGKTVKPDTRLY